LEKRRKRSGRSIASRQTSPEVMILDETDAKAKDNIAGVFEEDELSHAGEGLNVRGAGEMSSVNQDGVIFISLSSPLTNARSSSTLGRLEDQFVSWFL
jgi:hypothetical protein